MPGTEIIVREAPATRSAPTATDAWFVTGFADSGPIDVAVTVNSLAEFTATFGARLSDYPHLYDSIETFFREGGARAIVSRVYGAGGTVSADNRGTAVDADWTSALTRFTRDLGPGQVSAPGRTTQAAHSALLAHAQDFNRVGVLDAADTATVGTLTTAATAARGHADNRYGALFAPWVTIGGLTAGTTRTVPPSAFQAGRIARADTSGTSPNVPAAGLDWSGEYAIGVSQTYSEADQATLNTAGVNVILLKRGNVVTWGYRSLADPATDELWLEFGGTRLLMAILAKADEIAERYILRQIDGRGLLLGEYGGELVSMLDGYYRAGSLDGVNSYDAFRVDVGPTVNTTATIAARRITAVIDLRMSHMAETVRVELVKHATTESI